MAVRIPNLTKNVSAWAAGAHGYLKARKRRIAALLTVVLVLVLFYPLPALRHWKQSDFRKLTQRLEQYRIQLIGPPNADAYTSVSRSLSSYERLVEFQRDVWPGHAILAHFPAAIAASPELKAELEQRAQKSQGVWDLVRFAVEGGSLDPRLEEITRVLWHPQPPAYFEWFPTDNLIRAYLALADGNPTASIELSSLGLKCGARCLVGFHLPPSYSVYSMIDASVAGFDYLLLHPMDATIAQLALDRCRSARHLADGYVRWAFYRHSYDYAVSMARFGTPAQFSDRALFSTFVASSPNMVLHKLKQVGLARPENQRWLKRLERKKEASPPLVVQSLEDNESFRRGLAPLLAGGYVYLRAVVSLIGDAQHDFPLILRAAIPPQGLDGYLRVKLTSKPAVRKRLRHILETEPAFAENDPVLSSAFLSRFPPELQVALRIPDILTRKTLSEGFSPTPQPSSLHYRFFPSAGNLDILPILLGATRLQLLEIALASRVFRGQNGRWPKNVDELRTADLISTPLSCFRGSPRICDLYAEHQTFPKGVDWQIISRIVNPAPGLSPHPHLLGLGDYSPLTPMQTGQPRAAVLQPFPEIHYETESRARLVFRFSGVQRPWVERVMASLAGYAPLIENVRLTSSTLVTPAGPHPWYETLPAQEATWAFAVEAEFQRPRHFWVVYSRGPDGNDDNGLLLYDPHDPRTGLLGPGDLVQIIGWE